MNWASTRFSQDAFDQTDLDGILYLSRLTRRTCVAVYDRAVAPKLDAGPVHELETLAALPHRVHAVYAEQVSTPEERLVTDLHTLRGQKLSYFSLVILRQDNGTLASG